MGKLTILPPPVLDTAIEAWMRSKGVKLVSISSAERAAARQRLASKGNPSKARALRLVALWSLAPEAARRTDPISVRDMADFIEAEGFALEDAYGERTLVSETHAKGGCKC
ncbi:MAG: hypothetical protein AAGL90_13360 [Pseudomonadota bacterium]